MSLSLGPPLLLSLLLPLLLPLLLSVAVLLQEFDVRVVKAPQEQRPIRQWLLNLMLGLVETLNRTTQVAVSFV